MNPRHPPPKGRWNAKLAGPACSIAARVIFAVGGVAGVLTIPLPHWTAWLWLAGGVPAGATSSVRVCSSRSGAGGMARLTVWSASVFGGVLGNIIGRNRTASAIRTAAPSRRVFKEGSIRPALCESRRL